MNKFTDWVKNIEFRESITQSQDAYAHHIARLCGFGSYDNQGKIKKSLQWVSGIIANSTPDQKVAAYGRQIISARGNGPGSGYDLAVKLADKENVYQYSILKSSVEFVNKLAKKFGGNTIGNSGNEVNDIFLFDILANLHNNGSIDEDTAKDFYCYITGVMMNGNKVDNGVIRQNLEIIKKMTKNGKDPDAYVHPLHSKTHVGYKDTLDGQGGQYEAVQEAMCISPLNLLNLIVRNQGTNKKLQLPKGITTSPLATQSERIALACFPDVYRRVDEDWVSVLSGTGSPEDNAETPPASNPGADYNNLKPDELFEILNKLRAHIGNLDLKNVRDQDKQVMLGALADIQSKIQEEHYYDPKSLFGMIKIIESKKI